MLVLASGSPYRRRLLERLGLPFTVDPADVDESPRPGEAPAQLAARLARDKALVVAIRHPQAWVIGSDQVADLDGLALGKPGDVDRAREQLRACSGRQVRFHTALALARGDGTVLEDGSCPVVVFRRLDDAEIARYLAADRPFDCAGSFKAEALGISLFESLASDDPTAIEGLPLIALCRLLRQAGVQVP